jgi:hypothetical protein
MEKIVRKFHLSDDIEAADFEEYRVLTGNERLQILLELIMPENPNDAIIERSARLHALAEHEEC